MKAVELESPQPFFIYHEQVHYEKDKNRQQEND